jgi:hypothetical protein
MNRPTDPDREARRAMALEARQRRQAHRSTIHIGQQRIDTARYVKRDGRDSGETLLIFLKDPREVVRVEGREAVLLAVQEINRATAPDHPPGFWSGDGADED